MEYFAKVMEFFLKVVGGLFTSSQKIFSFMLVYERLCVSLQAKEMMNRTRSMLTAAAFLFLPTITFAQKPGSITFAVDEGLEPIEERYKFFYDGEKMAHSILYDENIPEETYRIVATSFADAQCLRNMGKDVFFQCIVRAYADHKSIKLSPDMARHTTPTSAMM